MALKEGGAGAVPPKAARAASRRARCSCPPGRAGARAARRRGPSDAQPLAALGLPGRFRRRGRADAALRSLGRHGRRPASKAIVFRRHARRAPVGAARSDERRDRAHGAPVLAQHGRHRPPGRRQAVRVGRPLPERSRPRCRSACTTSAPTTSGRSSIPIRKGRASRPRTAPARPRSPSSTKPRRGGSGRDRIRSAGAWRRRPSSSRTTRPRRSSASRGTCCTGGRAILRASTCTTRRYQAGLRGRRSS